MNGIYYILIATSCFIRCNTSNTQLMKLRKAMVLTDLDGTNYNFLPGTCLARPFCQFRPIFLFTFIQAVWFGNHVRYISTLILYNWRHGSHIGCGNKESADILGYGNMQKQRTRRVGGNGVFAKQRNGGHVGFYQYAKIIQVTSWQPFWFGKQRNGSHIEFISM